MLHGLAVAAWRLGFHEYNIIPLKIELYGTEHCCLCEQADALLRGLGIVAAHVDIVDDDVLFARYELRIPVLRRADTGAELGWPFDAAMVAGFLA